MPQVIKEKIQQRRLQVLVHSCLYYAFGTSLVSDHQYDAWGKELISLQEQYPEESSKAYYYNAFKNYTRGCTSGFNLPYNTQDIIIKAWRLLEINDAVTEDLIDILKNLGYTTSK